MRRGRIVLGLLVLLQLLNTVFLAVAVLHPRLHEAPVGIVAPKVVADALTAEIRDLDGQPFDARVVSDRRATSALRSGELIAVLRVDLAGTHDTMLLSRRVDQRLADAVVAQTRALEESRKRTVTVQKVLAPPGLTPHQISLLGLGMTLLGFGFIVVVSWRRGAIAPTYRHGVVRVVGAAAVSLACGAAVAAAIGSRADQPVATALILALAALLTASVTASLELLAGYRGLAVAVIVFLGFAIPGVFGAEQWFLPQPWRSMFGYAPYGVVSDALRSVILYDGQRLVRPLILAFGWLLVAWLASTLSRFERSHATGPGGHRFWRIRVFISVVPAVVALVLAGFLVPRGDIATATVPVDLASQTTCAKTGPIRKVADLNRIATQMRGGPAFQGGDVGATAQLSDGRQIAVFGDTIRSSGGGTTFVRNSMLLIGSDCLRVVVPASEGAIIPDRDGKVGYWPMSVGVAHEPGYDLVVVSAQRVRSTGTGAFAFQNLGPSMAVFIVRPGLSPQLVEVRDLGPDDTTGKRPAWGAAMMESDGWVYLYGTSNPRKKFVFGYSVKVARVRPFDILDRKAWRYWGGTGWVANSSRAVELIPAEGGVSQTFSVFSQGGLVYALSKRDEFVGHDLVVWRAPNPWGPFDSGTTVAPLPSDAATGQLRYMPLAHPDLLPKPGTVVASYSRNRTDVDQVIDDPMLYRPRFLRIQLPR